VVDRRVDGRLHPGGSCAIDRGNFVTVRDSNGNELKDGDAVMVIKDLKVKGSSDTLKRGTVFKGIRLTDDEEAIECGQGRNTVVLKTCFLKKA
jgi:protein PhnA